MLRGKFGQGSQGADSAMKGEEGKSSEEGGLVLSQESGISQRLEKEPCKHNLAY